jgi:hypothetical protein
MSTDRKTDSRDLKLRVHTLYKEPIKTALSSFLRMAEEREEVMEEV